jgi:hypothetical protein
MISYIFLLNYLRNGSCDMESMISYIFLLNYLRNSEDGSRWLLYHLWLNDSAGQ